MDFFRGFVILGIIAVVMAVLCFLLWKYYFCRVRGFENRRSTTLIGCILILASTITYLFIPLVLCKATLFTQTKNRFVDGIKNDIVAKTRDAFYEDAEDVITGIVNSCVGDNTFDNLITKFPTSLDVYFPNGVPEGVSSINDIYIKDIPPTVLSNILSEDELGLICGSKDNTKIGDLSQVLGSELQRAKQNVIQYAVKYSKNRTLKDSLDNAFKLFKIGAYNLGGLTEDITLTECNRVVDDYSRDIRKSYIKNSLMKPWVSPIVKNIPMETFTGLSVDKATEKAFNKAKDAFDKLFLLIAVCLSLGTSIVIFIILYLLREKEEETETKYKRNYMFEYNEKSFEEMNDKKV